MSPSLRITSALLVSSFLAVASSGCALFGNRPVDEPWKPSFATKGPKPPMYCFSKVVVGPSTYEDCFADLSECGFAQSRSAAAQETRSITPCQVANEPYCFVYDVQGTPELKCASSKTACENNNKGTNRGIFTPIVVSTCGPLATLESTGPATSATSPATDPVQLDAFLKNLDLTQASVAVGGMSNGSPLKPLSGRLSRHNDGTFSLYLTDLEAGGASEFMIDVPEKPKTGRTYERTSRTDETCPTYDNQVFEPKAGAYRFNDAACAWRVELSSLPKLPEKNPREGQTIGTAKGRVVLRLVQTPGFSRPVSRINPSWVVGTFELPVALDANNH